MPPTCRSVLLIGSVRRMNKGLVVPKLRGPVLLGMGPHPQNGRQLLIEWMEAVPTRTIRTLSHNSAISHSVLSAILLGSRLPTLAEAVVLQYCTYGRVPWQSWVLCEQVMRELEQRVMRTALNYHKAMPRRIQEQHDWGKWLLNQSYKLSDEWNVEKHRFATLPYRKAKRDYYWELRERKRHPPAVRYDATDDEIQETIDWWRKHHEKWKW